MGKKGILAVFVSFCLGIGVTLAAKRLSIDDEIFFSGSEEDEIEEKNDEIRFGRDDEFKELNIENLETIDGCNMTEEVRAIESRYRCNLGPNRAKKSWATMKQAKISAKKMLLEKDMQGLLDYTSCDSYDLTWYEMHCETDRVHIDQSSYEVLFSKIDDIGVDTVKEATWVQKYPDKRKLRNPRWLARSRLKSLDFHLVGPWKGQNHPTEQGTIILLEQKLDGKVNIVGIPVTGVLEDDRHD